MYYMNVIFFFFFWGHDLPTPRVLAEKLFIYRINILYNVLSTLYSIR
jgi:hypothetical protein